MLFGACFTVLSLDLPNLKLSHAHVVHTYVVHTYISMTTKNVNRTSTNHQSRLSNGIDTPPFRSHDQRGSVPEHQTRLTLGRYVHPQFTRPNSGTVRPVNADSDLFRLCPSVLSISNLHLPRREHSTSGSINRMLLETRFPRCLSSPNLAPAFSAYGLLH